MFFSELGHQFVNIVWRPDIKKAVNDCMPYFMGKYAQISVINRNIDRFFGEGIKRKVIYILIIFLIENF